MRRDECKQLNITSCLTLHHQVHCRISRNKKFRIFFFAGNRAGLSPGAARGHLADWLDPNGHNGGNQRPAREGGREDRSLGHEGLQGLVAHRHAGPAQAV